VFDLQLYTLNLHSGQESSDLPGFLALAADKRASRIRKGDSLALMLSMGSDASLPPALLNEVLYKAGETYFYSDGSITYGIRSSVEYLNKFLVNHNLKSPTAGSQVLGILNLAVVHDQIVYIAHAGPTHTFFISPSNFQDCYDTSSPDRGLGTSQSASVRFFQQTAILDGLVIFSPDPPPAWNENSLANSGSLGLDALHRRLINQVGLDLRAATFRLAEGSGQLLWRRLAPSATTQIFEPVTTPSNQSTPQVETPKPLPEVQDEQPLVSPPAPLTESIPGHVPATEQNTRVSGFHTRPGTVIPRHGVQLNYIPPKTKSAESFRKKLATWWLAGKTLKKKVNNGAQKVTSRVVPGLKIKTPALSTSTMLFIAIAIPLTIVTIGATVYIQRGRSVRHQYYLEQGQELVAYAQGEPDKAMQLIYWQQALGFILQAEDNGSTPESKNLLNTIQSSLDAMQGISRVSLEPALFETLPSTVSITKIVSSYDGVYALDAAGGRILHFTRKDQYTFQVDYNFACGPVGGSLSIGPLIDMIVLPVNDITLEPDKPSGASVMGIDASGNLLYCASGKDPVSKSLPAPSLGWGKIQAIAINEESSTLYVMDVKTTRIWIYESSDLLFTQAPTSFFDTKKPKDLGHMVGLGVNSNDLYLLNGDNTMTRCIYSALKELKQTECPQDPAQYQDLRGSTNAQPLILSGIQFTSMQLIRLPDSALYLLNVKEPALYKFGFQLNLFKSIQFSPPTDHPLPNRAVTGFGLTSDQLVFLAYGDVVYFGQIP
jgi:hypothetical protein